MTKNGLGNISEEGQPENEESILWLAPSSLPQQREDAFADTKHWRDDGCEVSPSCLSCPLDVCRYDAPGGIKGIKSEMRNKEVIKLHDQGHTAEFIAIHLELSRRSVFRILRVHKGKQQIVQ